MFNILNWIKRWSHNSRQNNLSAPRYVCTAVAIVSNRQSILYLNKHMYIYLYCNLKIVIAYSQTIVASVKISLISSVSFGNEFESRNGEQSQHLY